ncbi:hypothetical protein I7I51_06331 [Histoplasma capsulatum]|uniref:Uncharacterized protein n=1 Tax=Ajellomyces capsulatus TaxID=5037 RepID=A0A8A1MN34_AJECA|nr:hypothetical protein I7I51_06331 [Histoplasma capsulatum]
MTSALYGVFDFLSIESFNGPMSGAKDSRPSCTVLSIGSVSSLEARIIDRSIQELLLLQGQVKIWIFCSLWDNPTSESLASRRDEPHMALLQDSIVNFFARPLAALKE